MLTETEVEAIKPVRYARKIWDGKGLFLLVTPKGGRCWRYAHRFAKKYKKLALGTYPDVSLELARSRHEFARNLLANGIDPAALKAALGKQIFAATMREWEKAPGHKSELALCCHETDRAVPKSSRAVFQICGGRTDVCEKSARCSLQSEVGTRRRPT